MWPATLCTTVLFVEEAPDRTRVTVVTEPHGETTNAEVEAFVRERLGMTLGWTTRSTRSRQCSIQSAPCEDQTPN